ncbi:MAG: alpha/beta fold hydrolase [Lysobacteraceae bacterium]|nr:MAG: alpha/beta fold hydrolase [Xanthomonadaceae bacterium]
MSVRQAEIALASADGHRFNLLARIPERAHAALLWLPALGVAARHYLPLAEALNARGIAVFLHEWRGNGSSSLRASREVDWGYRQLLTLDLESSHAAIAAHCDVPVRVIGGHSIGAQLASCYLALHPGSYGQLWLVASGSPYWRTFPAPKRYLFPLAFQFVPWIAERRGLLHGRRYGFGGDEARSLMRDWARVGLSNRYAAAGLDVDLEAALAGVQAQAHAVLLARDWFAPRRSMQALLDKMPGSRSRITTLDDAALGARADHFAWMKQPQAVAAVLAASTAAGDA